MNENKARKVVYPSFDFTFERRKSPISFSPGVSKREYLKATLPIFKELRLRNLHPKKAQANEDRFSSSQNPESTEM